MELQILIIAQDLDIQSVPGSCPQRNLQIFPRHDLIAVYADDLVPGLQSRPFCDGICRNRSYDCRLFRIPGNIDPFDIRKSQNEHCQEDVHAGAGNCDQKPVPFRMRQEFVRRPLAFIFVRLAGHFHIAAYWERA